MMPNHQSDTPSQWCAKIATALPADHRKMPSPRQSNIHRGSAGGEASHFPASRSRVVSFTRPLRGLAWRGGRIDL